MGAIRKGKVFPTSEGTLITLISGTMATPTTLEHGAALPMPLASWQTLLETVQVPVWVVEQDGRVIVANASAKPYQALPSGREGGGFNVLKDLLRVEPKSLLEKVAVAGDRLEVDVTLDEQTARARIQWLADPGYFIVQLQVANEISKASEPATQLTVQELLQEREITYRNLLAAYLKLQEVNRQKTVFLASAAHELKTPLAVIKGYYDLMLTGSLGRLTDKQRDILEESKDSCERLVRLVSMFLNYSALESGKLVLQLRENDLRDCLDELAKRWSEAFQRKGVRLEVSLDPSIATFRFDYQKVQQAAANLLDNSLKHTPGGGMVSLKAAPHFWERRIASVAPVEERRRFRLPRPNSVEVSVSDTGPGIAAEHHQEIFEDFVRVDRNTSGMGLGLAIAKRLIQAHRGKIWVESEPHGGSKFIFLLPMDQG